MLRHCLGAGLVAAVLSPLGASAAPATTVSHVSPVDTAAHLVPGYTVSRTVPSADCSAGADAARHVYSCVTATGFLSPCWYEARTGSAVPHALCLTGPFAHKVVRVSHAKGLRSPKVDDGAPRVWGIETTTHLRCTYSAGATIAYQGRRISYFCGRGIVLLGALDRTGAQWRVRGAHYDFSRGISFTRPTTYRIATAVVGDPSPAPG